MKDRKNKAITLIALVITIIVLLILAGVTIATLTGENSLLNRAKSAKETSVNASIDENTTLADYETKIDESILGTREGTLSGLNFNNSEEILNQTYSMSGYETVTVSHSGWVVMEEQPNGSSGIFYDIKTSNGLKYADGIVFWMAKIISFPVLEGSTIEYKFWGGSFSSAKLTLLY